MRGHLSVLVLFASAMFAERDLAASRATDEPVKSRTASLAEGVAEAARLGETDAGKLYDHDFSAALSDRLADVVGQCTKDSKRPLIFDLVFVFAGDGRIERILQPPDSVAASCVAAQLGNLRLRAPPRAGWPVQLHIELRPPAPGEEAGQQFPPEPALVTADRELMLKAGRAAASHHYKEALAWYEKAIKVQGNFAPFVYNGRGKLYLDRAKGAAKGEARRADLQRAIADFKTSIALGAAATDQLNRGLEKVVTKANLDEATRLLTQEAGR